MCRRSASSLHPLTSVGCPGWLVAAILLAGLAPSYRAQSVIDTPVTITIGNNSRSTAILPDETSMVIIKTELDIILPSNSTPDFLMALECLGTVCTAELMMLNLRPGGEEVLEIVLPNSDKINQIITITIREKLDATCMEYPVPMNFTASTDLYVFTCKPLAPNRTNITVKWRKFRLLADLEAFMERPEEAVTHIIDSADGIFTVSGNGQNLTVNNTVDSGAESVAFYYVPSFQMDGSAEMLTAETFIFMGPKIMGEVPEFSSEVILTTSRARNFTGFSCNTDTFPPARVSWVLVNEEFPCNDEKCGVDVASLNDTFLNVEFVNSGREDNLTLSLYAKLHLLNLQFNQDGDFTCTADNGQASSTRRFRLRVKSNLRPLWPAVGIILVVLLVPILMLFSCTVERVVERKKLQGSRSPSTSPDHEQPRSSVSSSSGQSNSRARNHSGVKRLSSNKPLIDESTL